MHPKIAIVASLSLVFGALASTAATACKKDEPVGSTTTTSATTTSSTTETGGIRHVTATARISGRRCDRFEICDPFGDGSRHPSRADCDISEYARAKAELPEADCRNGIDDAKLRACIDAIAQQPCITIVDSLQTLDACKTATLCASP